MANGNSDLTDPGYQPAPQPGILTRPMFNGTAEPWWVRIIERLGLPTFLLLIVMYFGYQMYHDVRAETKGYAIQLVQAVNGFTVEQRVTNEKLDDLNDSMRDHAMRRRR